MPQTRKAMNTLINPFLKLESSLDPVVYPKGIGAYTDKFAVLSSAGTNTAKPPG